MRGQRKGAGILRAIGWLLVVIAFIYGSIQILPAYLTEYQLEDGLRSEARFAVVEHRTREQVREDTHRLAMKLGVPATLDDIEVDLIEGGYRIRVDYTVPINLFRYQFLLRFRPTADSNSI